MYSAKDDFGFLILLSYLPSAGDYTRPDSHAACSPPLLKTMVVVFLKECPFNAQPLSSELFLPFHDLHVFQGEEVKE